MHSFLVKYSWAPNEQFCSLCDSKHKAKGPMLLCHSVQAEYTDLNDISSAKCNKNVCAKDTSNRDDQGEKFRILSNIAQFCLSALFCILKYSQYIII